jgi:hypothetical protein
MLVCNVSRLRDPKAIATNLVEATAARDVPGTASNVFSTLLAEVAVAWDAPGFVGGVFGALVDDPASAGEYVNAYLGEIMLEAASAAAILNAGLIYAVLVDETVTALDVLSDAAPTIVSAAVVEAATAADAPDASVIAGVRFEGVLALDGPIMPSTPQPTVIYIEG